MTKSKAKHRRRFRRKPKVTQSLSNQQALYAFLEFMQVQEERALASCISEPPSPDRTRRLHGSYERLNQIGRRLHGLKRIGVTL